MVPAAPKPTRCVHGSRGAVGPAHTHTHSHTRTRTHRTSITCAPHVRAAIPVALTSCTSGLFKAMRSVSWSQLAVTRVNTSRILPMTKTPKIKSDPTTSKEQLPARPTSVARHLFGRVAGSARDRSLSAAVCPQVWTDTHHV